MARIKNSLVNNSGYQGAAFIKNETNEIVVANRGTEPTKLADWKADFQMGINKVPDQYQYAKDFLAEIKGDNPDADISLTGHSLGGAISQLQAAETGLYTETFNPYGAKDLVPDLNKRYGLTIDPEGEYSNIINHQTQFDGVSRLPASEQLGKMKTWTARSEWIAMGVARAFGMIGIAAESLWWSHSIDRFTEEVTSVRTSWQSISVTV